MQLNWHVKYADSALKQPKKLDKKNPQLVEQILDYMDEIAKLTDPRSRGKALVANLAGRWRYRVENYRIICEIEDNQLLITALSVEHRSKVYR
ncbi:type II toxin-antitoxin system RelE family toxin [Rodentibacter myodis]|uniref:Addiction module toxin RelE n=1 Tax=Rodentibacter myodis TaxID=1907939 RepID=A0A1V3JTE2_9PAST|nr:type II toxin-antitoxin system RelE/ParE family toxin [Rodentibacter myodis]OOF59711.1 addiction module toxin RelE [Rodentibacter myodis]